MKKNDAIVNGVLYSLALVMAWFVDYHYSGIQIGYGQAFVSLTMIRILIMIEAK